MLRQFLTASAFPALLALNPGCGDDKAATTDTSVPGADVADVAPMDDVASTEDVAPDTGSGDDAVTTADSMTPDDTTVAPETTAPAAAFEPGPWTALRTPNGEAIELLELVAMPADMPAAEARAAFVAYVKTAATSMTVETESGPVVHDLGAARAGDMSFARIGFAADGSVTSVAADGDGPRAKGTLATFGGCAITKAAMNRSYRAVADADDGTRTLIVDDATGAAVAVGPVASGTPPAIVGTFETADGQAYAVATSTTGFSVSWPNATTLLAPASADGRAATALIRLDAGDGPEGTDVPTPFLRLLPATTVRDVFGGASTSTGFLLERTELGSAGGAGRKTVGIQRIDLTATTPTDDSFDWKCSDACLDELDEDTLCGTTDHFRARDPQDPDGPETVVIGRFQGTLDFGGGVVVSSDGGVGSMPVEDSFVVVFDGDGNPRIGRKGGGMSVERVGFSPEGDVVLAGTFAGAAGLGLTVTASGTRDVFTGVFGKADLEPARAATFGTSGKDTRLGSDGLALEAGGTCTASGDITGFALRTNDSLQFAGIGANGMACVGDVMAVGADADVGVVAAPGGGQFFWLSGGSGLPWSDAGGEPGVWPPATDWTAAAGGSRARIMNNAR